MMHCEIYMPTKLKYDVDIVKQLGSVASEYGKKAFLLYDPYLKGSDTIQEIIADLKANGVDAHEFNDVVPNPRNTTIDAAAAECIEKGCDIVIGIGGGSAIDSCKAVALVATNGGTCWEYTERKGEYVRRPKKKPLPIITVPTTAGTGTECTFFSVINNPSETRKCTIINEVLYPVVSLVDPKLQSTVPPMTTALTGIDTFAHAFEGYIGKNFQTWTETTALRSISLFAKSIRTCVKDGGNLEARMDMAQACSLGGWAMNASGVALPHALGQPLSAYTDAPHGGTLAACLPQIIEWTIPCAEEKFAKVATIFDPSLEGKSTSIQAASLPDIFRKLYDDLGVDVSFGKYGLKEEDLKGFIDLAFTAFRQDIENHPKLASREDVEMLVRKCM